MKTATFLFGRINYILLFVGLALIALGYILMIGGGSDDPAVFNEEIFSKQRIGVAPILLVLGFVVEIFAIMYHPKSVREAAEQDN
ncbi:MAG: DUF3098 domain-containing protein [Flavobacteriia bacterium]|nr:DUF3098 domain-containing protein [Flavobacteriia bacterium]